MFVQVITAKVKDRAAVEAQREKWQTEVKPGAIGFLGSTGGITPDGQMIMVARFEDEASAKKNSERPEQTQFFKEMSAHMESEPSFFEATDITLSRGGGSDEAGFVQVMAGQVTDVEKARELDAKMEEKMEGVRPDLLGSVTAVGEDGRFYSVIYFRSEEEARLGEKEMTENPPPEMAEWGAIMTGEMTFYDLTEPWFA